MARAFNPIRPYFLFALWLVITAAMGLWLLLPASPADQAVAVRTILLGLSAACIAVPLGGVIVWVCNRRGLVPRMLTLTSLALLLVPLFIHVSSWDAAFGKLGWLTSTQGQILVPLISGWWAAVWIHGVAAAPQVALILWIGMRIGRRVFEEQALLDTSTAGVFWHVTIQRIWPLIILSVIWIVISCAREIAVTDIYQIGTLAEQVYLGYSLGINSIAGTWTPEQLAAAGSVGPGLTISIISWLAVTAFCLFFSLTDMEYESSAIEPGAYPRASWLQSVIGILVILLTVAVPVGNVLVRACFLVRPVNGVPTQGYSVEQLWHVIGKSSRDYQEEFFWSFVIGATSATLIVILATVVSALARRSRGVQVLFAISLAISCSVPGPTIGTTIAGLFAEIENQTMYWLYNYTIAAPVLANLIFCWPVGAMLVWFVFRKVPQDALDAANVDGAGRLRRFLGFGLVGNAAALIGCWLISFACCFGELSASQIVRPPGMDTVPRKMLGDLHAGVNEMTAGITIVTAVGVVVVSLVGWWFIGLNARRIRRK